MLQAVNSKTAVSDSGGRFHNPGYHEPMFPPDPLLLHTALAHEADFYPLGFTLHVATNSPQVLYVARESWGGSKPEFPAPPIEMRLVMVEENAPSPPRNMPVYRSQQNLFLVAVDQQNFGVCDFDRGRIVAWMTPAVLANPFFQLQMLEWMVYFTIDNLYIAIIHAACVARNGHGLLLCGTSGAGKSCLTYACVKSGWTLVADDFCASIRGRNDRMVIGKAKSIRFRPEAASLFPELAHLPTVGAPNGKPTIELKASRIPGLHTSALCSAEAVVFLERDHAGPVRLLPISVEDALARIESDQPRWRASTDHAQRQARSAILSHGAHILRYWNFAEAINLLDTLLG